MMVEKNKSKQILVPLLCVGLMSYFVYHAINGRHGLEARAQLRLRANALEQKLVGLETVRRNLERDVALLQSDNLDPDMLEEQARRILTFAHPNDVILREPAITN